MLASATAPWRSAPAGWRAVGHHYTGADRRLHYTAWTTGARNPRLAKWAHDRLLSPEAIRTAARNSDDIYEIAFTLNVSVEFLRESIGLVHGARPLGAGNRRISDFAGGGDATSRRTRKRLYLRFPRSIRRVSKKNKKPVLWAFLAAELGFELDNTVRVVGATISQFRNGAVFTL